MVDGSSLYSSKPSIEDGVKLMEENTYLLEEHKSIKDHLKSGLKKASAKISHAWKKLTTSDKQYEDVEEIENESSKSKLSSND